MDGLLTAESLCAFYVTFCAIIETPTHAQKHFYMLYMYIVLECAFSPPGPIGVTSKQ